MNPLHRTQAAPASDSALIASIVELAREASIELNMQDVVHLPASRALLPPGQRIYVSFLPKQSWQPSWLIHPHAKFPAGPRDRV